MGIKVFPCEQCYLGRLLDYKSVSVLYSQQALAIHFLSAYPLLRLPSEF